MPGQIVLGWGRAEQARQVAVPFLRAVVVIRMPAL